MLKQHSGIRNLITVLSLFFCAVAFNQCTTKNADTTSNQTIQKEKQKNPELADAMGQLQRYLHKFALAVEAENTKLASFYLHEVEASAEGIKKDIPGYEGYNIKQFMTIMFDPAVKPVETALANKNWAEIRSNTIDLVDACNSCHNATAHGFIEITPGFNTNSFNQNFSAPK